MAAKTKPNTPSGAPRWTYAVGAIVGAATLIWAIASYFIPKPEPAKPAPATPAAAPASSVTVSGDGSVGVGTMQGGTINIGGGTPPPPDIGTPPKVERK